MKVMHENNLQKDLIKLIDQANKSEIEYAIDYMKAKLFPKENDKSFSIQIFSAKHATDVVEFFRSINFKVDENLITNALSFAFDDKFAKTKEELFFGVDYTNNTLTSFVKATHKQSYPKSTNEKNTEAHDYLYKQFYGMMLHFHPNSNPNDINYINSNDEFLMKVISGTTVYINNKKVFEPIKKILEYDDRTLVFDFIKNWLNKHLQWNITSVETVIPFK